MEPVKMIGKSFKPQKESIGESLAKEVNFPMKQILFILYDIGKELIQVVDETKRYYGRISADSIMYDGKKYILIKDAKQNCSDSYRDLYLPPELSRDSEIKIVDLKVDVYSLGVLVMKMLFGEKNHKIRWFLGEKPDSQVAEFKGKFEDLMPYTCDESITALLKRMLDKNVADRITLEEMIKRTHDNLMVINAFERFLGEPEKREGQTDFAAPYRGTHLYRN